MNLTVRKHQTNPSGETFHKEKAFTLQKNVKVMKDKAEKQFHINKET